MGLMQLNFEGKNKIEVSIMRLKEFEPSEGYYFADSFGKDSCVVKKLLEMAKVKFDAHYSQGGIDPPELVQFGRKYHPDTAFHRPKMSVWKALMIHGLPRRQGRWCCELIKEKYGGGRRVLTGIRWQESAKRKVRRMVEVCQIDKTKIFVNPIIDWTSKEVWEFIRAENIPYCSLYDEGFKRLGCVLCPMETARQTQIELRRFPKIAGAWKRACYRYYQIKIEKGTPVSFDSPEKLWQWWLSRKAEPKINDAQCIMFDN